MAILPETKLGQIEFCEQHIPVWQTAPTSIGLSALLVNQLDTATLAARKAYEDALAAREASKARTTSFNADTRTMRDLVADMIAQIKAYADLQANPAAIFANAQLPMPLPPSPLPAPGKPTDILVTLQPTGAVTISWEAEFAAASSGAFYTVARKLPGQAGFVSVGGAPGTTAQTRRMSYTDGSVPTSAAGSGAQYVITGQRGTILGLPSDAIVVQFGVDGVGATVTGAELSIAA